MWRDLPAMWTELSVTWSDLPARMADSRAAPVLLAGVAFALLVDIVIAFAGFIEAGRQRRRQRLADRLSLFESDLAPPVSVLVHADRAAEVIVDRVRALLTLPYPAFEVIVAVDGDDDESLDRMVHAFGLRPVRRTLRARLPRGRVRALYGTPGHRNLIVVEVDDPGRAHALNAALACARHPLFLTLDARTALERDTLLRLALPFYEDSVLAVGAVARPAELHALRRDGVPEAPLPHRIGQRFEAISALHEALIAGLGWQLVDSLFVLPSPVALYDRAAVRAVGGYRSGVASPDADLVMRLQCWASRQHRRMVVRLVGGAVAWREPDPGFGAFASRRMREERGRVEGLWLNRELIVNTRFALHHGMAFLWQVFSGTLRPAFELAGLALVAWLVASGQYGMPFVWMFGAIYGAGGTMVTLLTLSSERASCRRFRWKDLETLAFDALLEPYLFRPIVAGSSLWGALRASVPRPAHRRSVPAEDEESRRMRAA